MHHSRAFVRTNYIITSIWALALAVIVVADLGMHFVPGVPLWVEIAAIVVALENSRRAVETCRLLSLETVIQRTAWVGGADMRAAARPAAAYRLRRE